MLRYILIFSAFSAYFVSCVFNPGPKYPPTKGEVWPKPRYEEKEQHFYVFIPTHFTFKVKYNTPIKSKPCYNYYTGGYSRVSDHPERDDGRTILAITAAVLKRLHYRSIRDAASVTRIQMMEDTGRVTEITNQNCTILSKAADRYLTTLSSLHNFSRWHRRNQWKKGSRSPSLLREHYLNFMGTLKELQIDLTQPCEEYPHFDMDEKYKITVNSTSLLQSDSVWGILRGLETLSQLFYLTDDYNEVRINVTHIVDFPRYTHRGLLLDTGRHYLRLTNILKTLDAMTMNKMNVFHWHIVDDQSFPYQSKKFPELSERGAYDASMVYTRKDIQMVINYARERGIRVIPEFDVPGKPIISRPSSQGHTRSWGQAHPEVLAKCYSNSNKFLGLGPMNPVHKGSLKLMKELFEEVQELFPDRYFHIGGDEVESSCWSSNPEIKEFMWKHNIENVWKLHAMFMKDTMSLLANGTKVIVWQEVFDENVTLPKDTLIQVWKYVWIDEMVKILTAGHKVLFSASWYLDILKDRFSDLYSADPRRMVLQATKNDTLGENIFGGEACMWGEMADDTNVLSRSWPRASAVAEVLWSTVGEGVPLEVFHRIEEHTCRMIRRGIPAEPPSGPGFCLVPENK